MEAFKVFVSHGRNDGWLATQIAKESEAVGAVPFLDESSIPKGAPDFKGIIRREISTSRELVALFTPWSAMRSWVWIEMGAAWNLEIPVVAVFYGMTVSDLDSTGQGTAILDDMNVITLNDIDTYFAELRVRLREVHA